MRKEWARLIAGISGIQNAPGRRHRLEGLEGHDALLLPVLGQYTEEPPLTSPQGLTIGPERCLGLVLLLGLGLGLE